jgi:hypothetical protein
MSPTFKPRSVGSTWQSSARLLLALALAWSIFSSARPAAAQGGERLVLLPPATGHFPTMSFHFEAYDAQGQFNTSLKAGDVEVVENGAALAPGELTLQQPGVQVITALTLGPSLAYTYNGSSRFDLIRRAIYTWARAQPAGGQNDYGLVAGSASLGAHVTDPQVLAQAINNFAPDLFKFQPGINSLIQALDLTSDPLASPLMKRSILYITPMLPDSALSALPNLAERAIQQGVHVSVWLILNDTLPANSDNKVADALGALASRSGGSFFTYTGSETFPDLDRILQPLRYTYQVTYASAIRQSGSQTLAVRLKNRPVLASAEQRFTLALQPPNPIFLNPPASIQMRWVQPRADGPYSLEPVSASVQMLVEFPDGFTRPLKAARLFVDGALASQLSAPPFEQLEWPLSSIQNSGKHLLRLEVEDTLGMLRSSIETPVEVQVPPAPLAAFRLPEWVRPEVMVPVAGVVLGGALLGAGGFWLFRRKRATPRVKKVREKRPMPRLRPAIPLPVVRRLPPGASAPARLMRISESGHVLPGSAIPLGVPELSIGSSARKAIYVLQGASVAGLHARLRQVEGEYIIIDAGSEAGTWVNCRAVPPEGARLQHGDLVQIGLETFRFELNHPQPPPHVCVTAWEE